MKIRIDDGLSGLLRVGAMRLGELRLPADRGDALWAVIEQAGAELAERYRDRTPGQIPAVQETRRLYRSIGLDPTKTRPSSEALLRRIIKGKGLYRIHPLVDLFNLASVTSQLSVGLYDEGRISGQRVRVQLGKPGWGFAGIRRGRINVAGRLCVVDEDGPFGSPTADSDRTCIEGQVERALAVFFQPHDGDPDRLAAALDHAGELAREHLAARIVERQIIEQPS